MRGIQWGKHCFVYCGKGNCNCGASASQAEREAHEEEIRQAEQDKQQKEEAMQQQFIDAFNGLAGEVNQTAIKKGWWKGDRNDGEMICLMHSELSEALEALRHDNPPDDHIPEFTGVEAELADTIIRIMDYAKAKNHRVAEAVIAKMQYNKTRAYKHGGKIF